MKKLAALIIIVGGVAAVGYAITRMMDEEQLDELRDRAIDIGLDVASEAARIVEDVWTVAQEKLGGGEIDVASLPGQGQRPS
jgi:hypothetical protein